MDEMQDTPAPADGVVAILERMERRLARLEERQVAMARLAEQAPAITAAALDTFDDTVARLAKRGVDVDERLRAALRLLERLTDPATLASLEQGLALAEAASGAEAAAIVDGAARALAETRTTGVRPVGAWGALRALSDPDLQRGLGVAVEFGRRFGKALGERGV